MEQAETNENVAIETVEAREAPPGVAPARSGADPVTAQAGTPGCPTCGGVAGAQNGGTASSSYVYALGQIETRFPRPLGGKRDGASHRAGGDCWPHGSPGFP